jgi:predicted dehydrogenase
VQKFGPAHAARSYFCSRPVLSRPSHRTWQRDTAGAKRFTRDRRRLSAVGPTRAKQWLDTGTNTPLDVTSPDSVLLSGQLASGNVASVHVGAIPFAGSGHRMEIYGRDWTLVATGKDSPQLSEVFRHGAKGDHTLTPMPVPERFTFAASAATVNDVVAGRRQPIDPGATYVFDKAYLD